MRVRILAAAMSAVLGLAPATHASVGVVIMDRGVPSSGSTVAVGYHAYVIRLISDSGNIQGIDAWSGSGGIFGRLVQRWADSDGNEVPEVPSPGYLSANNSFAHPDNFDSHFLAHQSNFNADAVSPSEDMGTGTFGPPGPNPPFPNNISNGPFIGVSGPNGTLKVALGVKLFAQSATFDLAYVVIPDSSVPIFSAKVATAGGTFPALVLVPEPAALWVVHLAAPLLLLTHGRRGRSQSIPRSDSSVLRLVLDTQIVL